MTTRITLIRHGQTDWNADGRWQGHAAVPLNDVGRQQAEVVGSYLASVGFTADYIYSSDLARARDTALIIAEFLDMEVFLDARFREMDAGEWQGLTVNEIKAWDGQRFEEMLSDPYTIARPGGECYEDQEGRAFDGVQDLLKKYPGKHIVVVAHEETIASVLRAAVGMEIPLSCLVPGSFIPNTSLTEVRYNEETGKWDDVLVGAVPHLEKAKHNGHR
ncbi:MAG: histidine phosphatase family protein [Chloroflexi bacterium]|nr:histidine phosphatase family protein [Chloroflexota bacterium]